MSETTQRAVAETLFERNQRREVEINDALKQEAARRAAVIENMHRLRALRLARHARLNSEGTWQVDLARNAECEPTLEISDHLKTDHTCPSR
jgi:phosphopantothenate synthetase